ncbi:unnamed protein product, partial [Cylicostephanus goldi]
MRQAKTFKENMKMIHKRKDAWNEKKRTLCGKRRKERKEHGVECEETKTEGER